MREKGCVRMLSKSLWRVAYTQTHTHTVWVHRHPLAVFVHLHTKLCTLVLPLALLSSSPQSLRNNAKGQGL